VLSDKERKELTKAQTDKELKKVFKVIASKNPDEYFPTKELRNLGYMRKTCESCGKHYWTVNNHQGSCGDAVCAGGFQVVVDNPSQIKLSFIGVWEKIVEMLEPRGYVPIKRYPCVARWNPTSEFTIASISAFQPYVITGEVEPPAKKLIIPQFCLRFNDIENVGITGSHNTGFVMIGQHQFVPPDEWDQGQLFIDIHDFIHEGVGLAKEEITIHEDSWAGGGSFGCSLEFFSRGVELFNQVYTMFEHTPDGPRDLKLKVLDMGLGQERVAWFSQGTPTIYEAIFPYVLSKLRDITDIKLDTNLFNKFSQYSAYLNNDEVDDMDEAWERVAKEMDMRVKELKKKIIPMTGLYSIADHCRSLLFAINDGKLPSNVGGGYNLRVIFRRAFSFIDRFKWDIDMADVCDWHAKELEGLFPEVSEHLNEVREIVNVERMKYYATKEKAGKILEKILEKGNISTETLIELYDSNGISPDMVKEAAKRFNIKIKIPDDFYTLVVEKHEKVEQIHATEKDIELNLEGIPETESLYYFDYTETTNNAKVLKIIDNMVIVDKTVTYPTSGGQLHDIGYINKQKFSDAFKQGNHTIHVLDEKPNFKEGNSVQIEVDKEWRKQLSQHHTATHIVNAAARDILGSHINQAGARKTNKNSHLDITHFEIISRDKLAAIERRANEIVEKGLKLNLSFIPRSEAEKKYGMGIYQGGAVPGKNLRIVEIPGIDVEACGGTHLNNTSETGFIHITKVQKIQDGIVRLKFTAGKATDELLKSDEIILEKLESILNVERNKIIGRIKELLEKRNKLMHKAEKSTNEDLELTSDEIFDGAILEELSTYLKVKKEGLVSKIKKLYWEWLEAKEELSQKIYYFSNEFRSKLDNNAQDYQGVKFTVAKIEGITQKSVQTVSGHYIDNSQNTMAMFYNEDERGTYVTGMVSADASERTDFNMGNFVSELTTAYSGSGGGNKNYGSGFVPKENANPDQLIKTTYKRLFEEDEEDE
jgi:alanyl-tRNA synthetase